MRKKLLAILIGAVLLLLFWAPWMGDDGGEEAIRGVSMRHQEELAELTTTYGLTPNRPYGCDGLSSRWAPFGRTVQYCDHQEWYVPFWK